MLTRHWALWLINTVWSQLMAAVTCWNLHSLIRHIIKLHTPDKQWLQLAQLTETHTHTHFSLAHHTRLSLGVIRSLPDYAVKNVPSLSPLPKMFSSSHFENIYVQRHSQDQTLKKRTAICELDCSKSLRLNAYDLFLIIYSSMDCVHACNKVYFFSFNL